MDPRFCFAHCESPLPVPPGASPFHIKGEFYRHMSDTVAQVARKTEGALTRILDREGLLRFTEQRFLSSTLYDVLPFPRITMCVAEALDRDVRALTTRLGDGAWNYQRSGPYAGIFGGLTTANFTERFPRVIAHLYDFGAVTAIANPDGKGAQVTRSDVPLCVIEWWSLVTFPFVLSPLTAGGARDVRATWKAHRGSMQGGIEMGEVTWQVSWS